MTALPLIITAAGLERFTAAQVDEEIDLAISKIGLTNQAFVAAPTLTALPGQFRQIDTFSGEAVGDNIVHLLIRDAAEITYTVRGFGLFLGDGTLFATYGQATPIFEKASPATMLLAVDIAFPTTDLDALTFGDTNFLDPPATTEMAGVVELATNVEALAGADTQRAVTPAALDYVLDIVRAAINGDIDALAARTITGSGLVTGGGNLTANRVLQVAIASAAEILTGAENGKAITPAGLAGVSKLLSANGYFCLPGGLIVQWGQYRASVTSQVTASLTFPLAFPNACFARAATPHLAAASTVKDLWLQLVGDPSTTGLTVQFQSDDEDNQGLDGFDWIAIGR